MRKPMLTKVREKVLATLPHMDDADLSHIASVCEGLLKLRAQVKRDSLAPMHNTLPEAIRDAIETGNGAVEIPPLPTGPSPRPSASTPRLIEDDGA